MNVWSKVDLENWPRKEHYLYYTNTLKIEFNMTANVNVENLLSFCHQNGKKFYPTLICLVTTVINSIENFRMFKDEAGDLCIWDYVLPNYTIFHQDDKTFSDCWSDYSSDFDTFYHNILTDMKRFKDKKGIKVRENQPPNFYCISCAPWTTFTGYSSRVTNGEPQYFPIITAGKYEQVNEKQLMPVNLTIAHAVCDGYHAGVFFESLQNEIDKLE